MGKRLLLAVILLAMVLLGGLTGNAGTIFTPVEIRTKTLTMTGVREAPAPEAPRDFDFTPLTIRTNPLTMTGMKD